MGPAFCKQNKRTSNEPERTKPFLAAVCACGCRWKKYARVSHVLTQPFAVSVAMHGLTVRVHTHSSRTLTTWGELEPSSPKRVSPRACAQGHCNRSTSTRKRFRMMHACACTRERTGVNGLKHACACARERTGVNSLQVAAMTHDDAASHLGMVVEWLAD